ncbi:MAG TPA: hypothetical protein VEQ87_00545, partial [Burkholderiales bacterium]|nr:hypothetical protein [Burkholderiales bacterium]
MAILPDDLLRWLDAHFGVTEAHAARRLLEQAVDHNDKPAGPRLLRCAAVGSRGNLEELKSLVELLKIDYRDVIMAGEYEMRRGQPVRLRDLNEPIAD